MGWQAIAYGSFLVANYVYHRWFAEEPPKPKPAGEIQIPRVDEGATYPLLYGRCRVRSPILAWHTRYPLAISVTYGFNYRLDMFMLLGIPFKNVAARLHNIWVGDVKLLWASYANGGTADPTIGIPPYSGTTFPGTHGFVALGPPHNQPGQMGAIGGLVQFYDGNAAQKHTEPADPWTANTVAGAHMKFVPGNGNRIPGYRGFLAVFHFAVASPDGANLWGMGDSPQVSPYSYEIASYPSDSDAFNVGVEANPAKVLYDLLTGEFGKLKFDSTRIDGISFSAAKQRLQEEGNGYSRAIEDAPDASQIVQEILQQIDGVLYEDPADGKIHIKLIRDDYDPAALIGVTTENCEEIQNLALGGFENVVNKVRLLFTDRSRDYIDGSAVAHNQAVAAGQDGEVRETLIRMPGVCTQALANELAARELAALSRPITKMRAIVDRTFYRVTPGDPVRVTWPEYGFDGRVFRVASVSRGTLASGQIALDLIEDFFYTWRDVLIPGHPVEPFPGGVVSVAP